MIGVDKERFLEHLGGPEEAKKLDPEGKADAMEDFLANALKTIGATKGGRYPTVAEVKDRLVTLNDLYSFNPNAKVSIEPFVDIIGRHFKQPREGLGNDNSPVAHMWRSLIRPDSPL